MTLPKPNQIVIEDAPQPPGFGVVHKKISLRPQSRSIAKEIEERYALSSVAARIAAARGFQADDQLANFLRPTLQAGLPNVQSLKNINELCELVRLTVETKGSIAICCDFDVDGLTGGSILKNFFDQLKITCEVFVPDRFSEGYGLNSETVKKIAASGFKLLITVDFGTTNTSELKVAHELGLKTIVIDHHHVEKIPPAD